MARISKTPKHLIIIDAGHGSTTPGKRSPFTPQQIEAFRKEWAGEASPNPLLKEGATDSPNTRAANTTEGGLPLLQEGAGGEAALYEWSSNRDLAQRIQQGLIERGYDARLLVPEEWDISLKARIRRAKELCEDHKANGGIWPNRLLVSIHSNASGSSSPSPAPSPSPTLPKGKGECASHQVLSFGEDSGEASAPSLLERGTGGEAFFGAALAAPSGWECYCSSSANARSLAALLYKQAYTLLPDCFPIRGRKGIIRPTPSPSGEGRSEAPSPFPSGEGWGEAPKTADFYLLKNAPCLSVLTENLFMDNIKDCAYLLTEEGRDLLAQIHINAIDEFLGYNDSQGR